MGEGAAMEARQLIGYQEAMVLTGLPKRTLLDRIDREGVTVYVDGRDRRRRLIDRRDIPKLIKVEVVERSAESAA